MGSIRENFIWLNDPVDPCLSQQLTGKFQAHSEWAAYQLDLCLSSEGILTGQFDASGQLLEIKGSIGKRGVVYGFLLEPVASVPVGLFRIKRQDKNLDIELDLPDFDTLLDHCSPQSVSFERVAMNRATGLVNINPFDTNRVDIKHSQTGLLTKGASK